MNKGLSTDLMDIWGVVSNDLQLKHATIPRIEMMLRNIFMNRATSKTALMVQQARGSALEDIYNKFKTKADQKQLVDDVAGKWSNESMPRIIDLVKRIKSNPDGKLKSQFLEQLRDISPMMTFGDYMDDQGEPDAEQDDEAPSVEAGDEPGYLRKMVKGGAGMLGLAAVHHFSRGALTGGIIRGAAAMYGMHKWAKGSLTTQQAGRAVAASSTLGNKGGFGRITSAAGMLAAASGRPGGTLGNITRAFTGRKKANHEDADRAPSLRERIGNAFTGLGMGGDADKAQGDFTPGEETKENSNDRKHMIGMLEKIEENTRALNGVKPSKSGDPAGGEGYMDNILQAVLGALMYGKGEKGTATLYSSCCWDVGHDCALDRRGHSIIRCRKSGERCFH